MKIFAIILAAGLTVALMASCGMSEGEKERIAESNRSHAIYTVESLHFVKNTASGLCFATTGRSDRTRVVAHVPCSEVSGKLIN